MIQCFHYSNQCNHRCWEGDFALRNGFSKVLFAFLDSNKDWLALGWHFGSFQFWTTLFICCYILLWLLLHEGLCFYVFNIFQFACKAIASLRYLAVRNKKYQYNGGHLHLLFIKMSLIFLQFSGSWISAERSTFTFLALRQLLSWLHLILNHWVCLTYCTSRSNDRSLKDNSCRCCRSQNQWCAAKNNGNHKCYHKGGH